MPSEQLYPFKDFFNLTEYREVIVEIICSLGMQESRVEFDTGSNND